MIFLMKFPPMGPFMTELYPTEVRGTAQGFCYSGEDRGKAADGGHLSDRAYWWRIRAHRIGRSGEN
jgi:hypothetical protein